MSSKKDKKLYQIEAAYEVRAIYRLKARSGDEALEQIRDNSIFGKDEDHGSQARASGEETDRFGIDHAMCERQGIQVHDVYYTGDPSPTGVQKVTRRWVVGELAGEGWDDE